MGDLKASTYNKCSIHSFVVQSLSCVRLFATPWTAACQASLSFTIFRSLLKLMSIESVVPFNCPVLCRPLLLLPSIFPSIRVFSDELALRIRWPEHCNFSFSTSPSSDYSGLISFRMDWLDLLAVPGALRASPTPQFRSINSWALSLPYGPTLGWIYKDLDGKTCGPRDRIGKQL